MSEVKTMEEYVGRSAFNEFMQIIYEQLSLKAGTDVVEEIKEKISAIEDSESLLTVDDIVNSFADFDPDAEGVDRKVAAAALVKSIKEAVDALDQKFEDGVDSDTLGGLGKDDFVKSTNVIASWDEYDEETVQVVAATLIKTMDEKLAALEEKVDDFIESKGKANGIAPLDENGMISSDYLPGYVDDVVDVYVVEETTGEGDDEVTTITVYEDAEHTTEVTPATGKIYVDVTNPDVKSDTYRWSGTAWVNMSCPKLKEITAEEVQAMWDSIVVPEETSVE